MGRSPTAAAASSRDSSRGSTAAAGVRWGSSPLAEAVQQALGDAITIRNAATMAKIVALAERDDE